jgi:hypothetical protein
MTELEQQMVEAIRSDKLVGRGTCSSIDECFDDADIIRALQESGINTIDGALTWAREQEGLFMEQGLNARWGEDSDPQLGEWQAWQQAQADNPV